MCCILNVVYCLTASNITKQELLNFSPKVTFSSSNILAFRISMKLLHYCACRKKENPNVSEFHYSTILLLYFFCSTFEKNLEQKLANDKLKMNILLQLTAMSLQVLN